jgi:hypothetical protein
MLTGAARRKALAYRQRLTSSIRISQPKPAQTPNARSRLGGLLDKIKQHPIIALMTALGAALIVTGNSAEGFKTTYELFFPPPDALVVADQKSKLDISQDFIKTHWTRFYRNRNLLARISRQAPAEEINSAWVKFIESVEDTSSRTTIYTLTFQRLYDQKRADYYQDFLQNELSLATQYTVNLFYDLRKNGFTLDERRQCQIKTGDTAIDAVNVQFRSFVSCFDEKQTETGRCEGGERDWPGGLTPVGIALLKLNDCFRPLTEQGSTVSEDSVIIPGVNDPETLKREEEEKRNRLYSAQLSDWSFVPYGRIRQLPLELVQ